MSTSVDLNRLEGVPSYHFEPIFAQRLQRIVTEFRPDCIAVELPETVLEELLWAVEQWPLPCASLNDTTIFPFIPGDSILEAARLAITQNLRLEAIDAVIDSCEEQSASTLPLPDPHWFMRSEKEHVRWQALLDDLAPPPTTTNLIREATMAQRLSALLHEGLRVLWVGGAAHWQRIRERIATADFTMPETIQQDIQFETLQRVQLEPSALLYLTGLSPFLLSQYAASPENYSILQAFHNLVIKALKQPENETETLVLHHAEQAQQINPFNAFQSPESTVPIDAAHVLRYARNLAATKSLRSTPTIKELLDAATTIIGPRYAGRIYEALFERQQILPVSNLPKLSYQAFEEHGELQLDGKIIRLYPYWPSSGFGLQILKLKPTAPTPFKENYSMSEGQELQQQNVYPICHPADRRSYLKFVEYVFRMANQRMAKKYSQVPFYSGFADGIDVRATLQATFTDDIWLQESNHSSQEITNAIIDWEFESESHELLQGSEAGWTDPSEYFAFGSASRHSPDPPITAILNNKLKVDIQRRNWTVLTLDNGTTAYKEGELSFYDQVILPLVELQGYYDDIYHWLDIIFRACPKKPVAYFSRYIPSAKIHKIAAKYRVRLIHIPLNAIPAPLLERHHTFRFIYAPSPQFSKVAEQEAKSQPRLKKH